MTLAQNSFSGQTNNNEYKNEKQRIIVAKLTNFNGAEQQQQQKLQQQIKDSISQCRNVTEIHKLIECKMQNGLRMCPVEGSTRRMRNV